MGIFDPAEPHRAQDACVHCFETENSPQGDLSVETLADYTTASNICVLDILIDVVYALWHTAVYLLTVIWEMFVEGPEESALPYAGSEFLPPGLTVINDFITDVEEEQLLAGLDWTYAETGQQFRSHVALQFSTVVMIADVIVRIRLNV